jgi:hypothetical protein
MTLLIANVFTSICALAAIWFAWRIYRIVPAPAVFVLTIAIAYIFCVRVAVTLGQLFPCFAWIPAHSSYLLIPYYPLLATALYLLYRTLHQRLE